MVQPIIGPLCVGDLVKAVEHLETFYKLARKHKWHTDSGDSLHEISCEHLRRLYTKLAETVRTIQYCIIEGTSPS